MIPSIRTAAALLCLLANAPGARADDEPLTPSRSGTDRQRGVSWVAGPQPVTRAEVEPLLGHNVDWIVQTPFGWQDHINSPVVHRGTGERVWWGERDEGLRITTELARELGIRTLLKPHIWLIDRSDGKWRSDIRMESEKDWQQWFASYREFILHYARFAEEHAIEALAIGTELHQSTVGREQDWRRLIAEIRNVYSGDLTYAANWWQEYEQIAFWDALDFIGIQAYFPLTDRDSPTLEQLTAGWAQHLAPIEAVQKRFDKPVLFTEIGYKGTPGTAIRPWEWPQRRPDDTVEVDLETQARCYEAFFRTFWHRPWFAGAYFWKWYPSLTSHRRPPPAIDFTPQGKPAEEVMTRWYGHP
jgi:hypothetical protein